MDRNEDYMKIDCKWITIKRENEAKNAYRHFGNNLLTPMKRSECVLSQSRTIKRENPTWHFSAYELDGKRRIIAVSWELTLLSLTM